MSVMKKEDGWHWRVTVSGKSEGGSGFSSRREAWADGMEWLMSHRRSL